MKDKFFDKPQHFDSEDEAFFNKHYGKQARSSVSAENEVTETPTGINEVAEGTVIIDPKTNELKIISDDSTDDTAVDQIIKEINTGDTVIPKSNYQPQRQRRRISVEEARAQLAQKQNSASNVNNPLSESEAQHKSSSTTSDVPIRRRRVSTDYSSQTTPEIQSVDSTTSHVNIKNQSISEIDEEEYDSDFDDLKSVKKKKKKHHIILKLLLLFIVFIALIFIFKKQPVVETEGLGERTDGISTILLAGVDDEAYRTDTLMLLSIDNNNHTMSLMSIPRDTYLDYGYGYNVPKINSAYGFADGGEAGIDELMKQIENIIGFKPDGYVMFDFDDFVDVVNLMGGVDFDVPMDMQYSDPTQDLEINLSAGEQHLNGNEAIQLVRFRSGYANADITRTEVQRDFMKAAMDQWTSPLNLIKLPILLIMVKNRIDTNLSLRNLAWLATAGLKCDLSNLNTQILPGSAQYIGSGAYYVADSSSVKTLMINSFSPYKNM